ncbi:MAG: CRISPR-associated helicase Cas3' [Candidatus Ancillula sp.]|jgi:CRISPR-associated endonuclease/helicase Cas3|nr:CRISPR-associated helicase Cas3' [Candidatus Ancillula sp.]
MLLNLSPAARILRGKSNGLDKTEYLPLHVHMSDSAKIMELLWGKWLSDGTEELIASEINDDLDLAKKLVVFLSAAHDIGKASPEFQFRVGTSYNKLQSVGLSCEKLADNKVLAPHNIVSQLILNNNQFNDTTSVILGTHHGKPPSNSALNSAEYELTRTGFKYDMWEKVQRELLEYSYHLAGLTDCQQVDKLKKLQLSMSSQALLSGLVSMADWIASDSDKFPLIGDNDTYKSAESMHNLEHLEYRARTAFDVLNLPKPWNAQFHLKKSANSARSLYSARFTNGAGFKPHPVQEDVEKIVLEVENPGIMVIEAPMGEGKTEAALIAAEVFAAKTKRGGVYIGLPTMATTDAMFSRVKSWIETFEDKDDISMYLAHSKSELNGDWDAIRFGKSCNIDGDVDDKCNTYNSKCNTNGSKSALSSDRQIHNIIAHEWFSGRHKGNLANFVVGTVDQLLFMALKMKYFTFRHLAFANKVVIIDEVHAYDAYMNEYIKTALKWLGKYKVPVILLSATLPAKVREELLHAYLGKDSSLPVAKINDYPLITYSTGKEIYTRKSNASHNNTEVVLELLNYKLENVYEAEEFASVAHDLVVNGGVLGIIMDTVDRAQKVYEAIFSTKDDGTEVILVHSRFIGVDRMQKEQDLRKKLGVNATVQNGKRPSKFIVVGTQVLEQSLDIDFDVLITDICPIDLLLQRIGRLHRHKRTRTNNLQQAKCFITGVLNADEMEFEPVIEKYIYNRYLLMRTLQILKSQELQDGPSKLKSIDIPGDISNLVQRVYSDTNSPEDGVVMADELSKKYEDAKADSNKARCDKVRKSEVFRIMDPKNSINENKRRDIRQFIKGGVEPKTVDSPSSLIGLLDIEVRNSNENAMSASVRDTSESLEVIIVQKKDGKLYLFTWVAKKFECPSEIPVDDIPKTELAKIISQCSVNLPYKLSNPGAIDATILAIEGSMCKSGLFDKWQESYYLSGKLVIAVDERLELELDFQNVIGVDYTIRYDREYGIILENKKGKEVD